MTPVHKTPTKEAYDTTLPKLYNKATDRAAAAKRNLSRLRFDVTDPSDVACARPAPYPLPPLPVFTLPVRGFSEALRSVGGQVIRQIQDYK